MIHLIGHLISDLDATILQAILAIPAALILFVALVVLVLSEWKKRRG